MILEKAKYRDYLPSFWALILQHQIRDKDGFFYGPGFYRKNYDYAVKWIYESEPSDSIAKLFSKNRCVYCETNLNFNASIGDHIVGKKLEGVQWRVPCCKTCNSSKRDYDLVDWWSGKKNRAVIDIDKPVWAIYVRAKIRLLKQEKDFDKNCSDAFLIAYESLQDQLLYSNYC